MKQLGLFGEIDSNEGIFTDKTSPVIYTPTGINPHPLELYDKRKTNRLISRICQVEMDADIKKFLLEAATRHTVFNYNKIAEFYAHADKNVQELMEHSALVIIDYQKAIELGYIRLSDEIKQRFIND